MLHYSCHHKKSYGFFVVVFFVSASFFGCGPDLAQVEALSSPSTPDQILENASIYYSKNGIVEICLHGNHIESHEGNNARRIFRNGVFCEFFNPDKTLKATLSSKEAIDNVKDKLIEIRNDVVIIDYRNGDTIYCEQVFWNQNNHIIYSDKLIKRMQPTGVSFGDGFIANEQFDSIRIKNLRGVHNYEEAPPENKE